MLETIPKNIDYSEGKNHIVIVSQDNCPPCLMLEKDWVSNNKLQAYFSSVHIIKNPEKNYQKKLFNNTLLPYQPITPTIIVYRYSNGEMSMLHKQVGYKLEDFIKFIERFKNGKNEKDKLETIGELPSLTEGIFGKKD